MSFIFPSYKSMDTLLPYYDGSSEKKFQNSFSSPVQEKVTEQADTPYSALYLIVTDAKLYLLTRIKINILATWCLLR